MRYRFRCRSCSSVNELNQPVSAKVPDTFPCGYCPGSCTQVIEAPAVLRGGVSGRSHSGTSDMPLDTVVGRNAAERWEKIHERQAERDRVRRESGQQGLTATSEGFAPLSPEVKSLRTAGMAAVEREGYKQNDKFPA
jgi:hypothetical protein